MAACTCKKKKASAAQAKSAPGSGVRVALERKGRGGKVVSVVTGLGLAEDALRELATELKRRCGTGGTVKEGTIEIQGDHRDQMVDLLKEKGYNAKKAGG